MFVSQTQYDKEDMLLTALMSSKMVDPSMMAVMTANHAPINNFAAPAAPSESMLGMQAQTGAIDNTAATVEALSQAQTLDPAFLQAQQNAESEIAREQMIKELAGASAAMAYQPTSVEMIPLQRGGGMMAVQEPPMMMGQTSASQGQDIMGLLNRFK